MNFKEAVYCNIIIGKVAPTVCYFSAIALFNQKQKSIQNT